jgi:putative flippase GtrA
MKGFAKFVGIGGLATAFQYGLMILFIEYLSINAVVASASSYAISAFFNYLANYYLTFSSDTRHLQTLPKFILATSFVLILNTLLFSVFFNTGMHYLIAQVIATVITLFVNFAIHKFWIYRK